MEPRELVIVGRPNPVLLTVQRRVYAKADVTLRDFRDRNQINAARIGAVNAEVIALPSISASRDSRGGMVRVTAGRFENDNATPQPSGLALHACESTAVVEHKVVPRVLAKWNQHSEPSDLEREHHRQRRLITDVFWMCYRRVVILENQPDGATAG